MRKHILTNKELDRLKEYGFKSRFDRRFIYGYSDGENSVPALQVGDVFTEENGIQFLENLLKETLTKKTVWFSLVVNGVCFGDESVRVQRSESVESKLREKYLKRFGEHAEIKYSRKWKTVSIRH